MTTLRETPCVSVNQLGQYLTGTPSLRKRIIHGQRNPVDPQYLRYPAAAQAITEYLCEGRDEVILRYHQRRLLNAQPDSDFDAHRLALCAEALQRCLLAADDLASCAIASPADMDPAPLEVAGVSVKVRPEVLLRGVDARGQMRSGVLKLYFSKHVPLDERAGQYIATVLHRFAEERLEQRGPVDPRLVGVFDVFAGRLFMAPKSQQRRLNDVLLACEEIAGCWNRN
ncbi:hypothetical protein [Myxococcus qinghaiensis]|uniref:hypothetical protein n=1 Tax=Myxococcus qinghaiensis TaxID=2906758 RepID=UPI0020A7FB24|nr:hypothetical protein [Myxococcus qinghaiensis]MCP3161442.1 hypothetical protein [Myxococcus qinghaiensis]